MKFDSDTVEKALVQAISLEVDDPVQVDTIVFHLIDWLDDLAALASLYAAPSERSPEDASEILRDFLIHAPNHLAAAGRLFVGTQVAEIFGVDAVDVGPNQSDER